MVYFTLLFAFLPGDAGGIMKDILITRLEEEMKKQGFSYKSLSRAAGLGETNVRDIITRRALNPRRDTLQKLAMQLDTVS